MIASLFRLQAAQLGHLWRVTVLKDSVDARELYQSSCSCPEGWLEDAELKDTPEGSYRRWEIHVIESVGQVREVEAIATAE